MPRQRIQRAQPASLTRPDSSKTGGADGEDPRKALRWFKKAAKAGDAKAAEMVEELKYNLGYGSSSDDESSGGEGLPADTRFDAVGGPGMPAAK